MRFELTTIALLSLFLFMCNATPRGQKRTESGGAKYSIEEDQFIIEELPSLLDKYQLLYSGFIWDKLAEKHRKKWVQKATGFHQERTGGALRCHFKDVLLFNHLKKRQRLPESLAKKLTEVHQNKEKKGFKQFRKRSYSKEEDKFIFEELSKPDYCTILGTPTVEALHKKINEKYHNKVAGFENARTLSSVRRRLFVMKDKNLFPKDLVKKFSLEYRDVGGNGSTSHDGCGSSSQEQQNDLPVMNEGEDEDAWATEMIAALQNTNDLQQAGEFGGC